jgi:hypothetical protein
MYGKHFASMYSGSLFGKPALVFAVWGYALSHMRPSRSDNQCYVELNPTLLAATFATTVEEIDSAIETLEAPDPASRSKTDDGRRLVLIEEHRHAGPLQFRVVNGAKYRAMRDEEERRTYLREAKRKERARKSTPSTDVNTVNRRPPPSAQAEVEAEAVKPLSSDVRPTSSKNLIAEDAIEYRLATELLALILKRNPKHRRPNLQTWARDMGLMIRRDNRDPDDIRRLMIWAQADDVPDSRTGFCWANNVLSPRAVREHFDQLELKSRRPFSAKRDQHEEVIGRATF